MNAARASLSSAAASSGRRRSSRAAANAASTARPIAAVQAAQAVAVLGQLQHTVGTVVHDQPFQGEGEQRQRVGLVEIG